MFTLLTATEIKELVPSINTNIGDTMINESCYLTQESLLVDSIGQEFYEEIVIQKSGSTLTTANQYLFDSYLKYILAYGVWMNLCITLSYQLNEAGVRVKTSDHSTLAEAIDISFLKSYIQNLIDNKRELMNRYIRLNNNYPKYYSSKYGDSPSTNIYNFKIGKVSGSGNTTNNDYDIGPVI